MDVQQQRILITGGTRGIGRALALELKRRGAAVAVCGRSAPTDPSSDGMDAVPFFACDLTDVEALAAFADRVRRDFGAPTVLVNNAGVQFNHDWLELDPGELARRAHVETVLDLTTPVVLTALFRDDLLRAPNGAVVNLTSILALAPKASAPVYSAAKAGLRSFTLGLRDQLAGRCGLRVVEVAPPMVDTEMTSGRGKDKMTPQAFADAVADALSAGLDDIWIGKARIVHRLWRWAPGLVRRILSGS
jgi:uncharacterized oxidoreductase